MTTLIKTVNLHQLRVAAINGFLIYIDGKYVSYGVLQTLTGYRRYTVTKQDLREWRVNEIKQ